VKSRLRDIGISTSTPLLEEHGRPHQSVGLGKLGATTQRVNGVFKAGVSVAPAVIQEDLSSFEVFTRRSKMFCESVWRETG
jgi:hypothetical protein